MTLTPRATDVVDSPNMVTRFKRTETEEVFLDAKRLDPRS
jgi:hypothetical protein